MKIQKIMKGIVVGLFLSATASHYAHAFLSSITKSPLQKAQDDLAFRQGNRKFIQKAIMSHISFNETYKKDLMARAKYFQLQNNGNNGILVNKALLESDKFEAAAEVIKTKADEALTSLKALADAGEKKSMFSSAQATGKLPNKIAQIEALQQAKVLVGTSPETAAKRSVKKLVEQEISLVYLLQNIVGAHVKMIDECVAQKRHTQEAQEAAENARRAEEAEGDQGNSDQDNGDQNDGDHSDHDQNDDEQNESNSDENSGE